MAYCNLDNSKKIMHLLGENCHASSSKIAALAPATQEEAVTASKSLQFFVAP